MDLCLVLLPYSLLKLVCVAVFFTPFLSVIVSTVRHVPRTDCCLA